MTKKLTFIFIVLAAVGINLYLVMFLIPQVEDFRLKNGPISIDIIDEEPPAPVTLMDIDGDKEEELISGRTYYTNPLELRIDDPLEIKYKRALSAIITTPNSYHFLDAHHDHREKRYLFKFLERVEASLFLRETDQNNNVLNEREFKPFIPPFRKNSAGFAPLGLFDLEEDGKKELLIIYTEGFFASRRGFACYNLESEKLLWTYPCGPNVWDVIIKDLDGNGKQEIIFSTTSQNNGVEDNGTSDAYSYVIVLDSKGKELWKRKTGGWYTCARIDISDLDSDGTFEIAAATSCHRVYSKNRGKIFIFDAVTGEKKNDFSIPDASFSRPYARKCDKNKIKIFVGDSKGRLWTFDEGLNHKVKTIKEHSPITVLNNSPRGYNIHRYLRKTNWPYLTILTLSEVIVYDWGMEKKLFQYAFERPITYAHINDLMDPRFYQGKSGRENYAFLSADKFYRLSESGGSTTRVLKLLVTRGFISTFLILFIFNGFIIYLFYRVKTGTGHPGRPAQGVEVLLFFERLQEMAHQLKNPVSTLLWTAEKIKRSHERDKKKTSLDADSYNCLADLLMDDVRTLQTRTDHILELIRGQSVIDVHKPRKDKDLEK